MLTFYPIKTLNSLKEYVFSFFKSLTQFNSDNLIEDSLASKVGQQSTSIPCLSKFQTLQNIFLKGGEKITGALLMNLYFSNNTEHIECVKSDILSNVAINIYSICSDYYMGSTLSTLNFAQDLMLNINNADRFLRASLRFDTKDFDKQKIQEKLITSSIRMGANIDAAFPKTASTIEEILQRLKLQSSAESVDLY